MSKSDIFFKEELFNEIYIPYFYDRSRFLNIMGGAGSAKSFFFAQKFLMRMLIEEGHRFLMVRKIARTIRRSCYQQLKDVIDLYRMHDYFKTHDTSMEIYCPSTDSLFMPTG